MEEDIREVEEGTREVEEDIKEGVEDIKVEEDTREEVEGDTRVEEGGAREVVEEVEGGCREEAGQEVAEGGVTEHGPALDPPVIHSLFLHQWFGLLPHFTQPVMLMSLHDL